MFKEIKKNEILIITGNDKTSNNLIFKILNIHKNIKIAIDSTLNIKKIIKLLIKSKDVSIAFLFQSFIAERLRKNYEVPEQEKFRNKEELVKILNRLQPKLIIVFRGSLIFPKEIIDNYKIINIHCSDITNDVYVGLGAIYRSYYSREESPKVTVHEIETKIDSGKILLTKNYNFNFNKGYRFNEDIAYLAGINSLFELLDN
tara:strand:+ start:1062 stop:1667 length:606 start_codon:yes stop_codon:yes gene_type:complete